MFSFMFNYDILKYILNGIFRNQKKYENYIMKLKDDNLAHMRRQDELEKMIISLQLENLDVFRISEERKIQLIDKRDYFNGKSYEMSQSSEEVVQSEGNLNYSKLIENQQQLNKQKSFQVIQQQSFQPMQMQNQMPNKNSQLSTPNQQQTPVISSQPKINFDDIGLDKYLEISEFEKYKEELKNTMQNEIYSEISSIKKTIISEQKNFIEYQKEKEIESDKLLGSKLPELIKEQVNILMTDILNEIKEFKKQYFNDYNKLSEQIEKFQNKYETEYNTLVLRTNKFDDSILDNKTQIHGLKIKTNEIFEKFNFYLTSKEFIKYKNDIKDRLKSDNDETKIETSLIKKSLDSVKSQLLEILNDSPDHNNILTLVKKFETTMAVIFSLQEFQRSYEENEKKKIVIDPSKFVKLDGFLDFQSSIQRTLDIHKKELININLNYDNLREKDLPNKCGVKDLKVLEENILNKMENLKDSISGKFWINNM